jgi:hypothetical protein
MPRALHLISLPALLLALASCTTNGGNTFIVATKVILPTGLDPVTGACAQPVFSPNSPETSYAVFGTDAPLKMGLVLENRMKSTPIGDRLNSNDFTSTSAVIKYESTGTGAINIPERTVPAQGYIPATGSGEAVIDVVSTADAATLKTQMGTDLYVRVNIHVVGKLNDGHTVQSSDYFFIVTAGAKSSQCQ